MNKNKYYIFNHPRAFDECRIVGAGSNGEGVKVKDGEPRASLTTPLLDSGEPAHQWQRVLADATVPDGGTLVWRFRCGDGERALDTVFTAENTVDFIPLGTRGRYASLEAEITGGVTIRSIQIFSEWESFLDYLPEIYRDRGGFTDRFLRLFSASFLAMEQRIDEMPGLFDPAVAPDDGLRRLAECMGVPHVNLWDPGGLRKLLAGGIYQRRGQMAVFTEYIACFTGCRPYAAEHFRYRTGRPENDRLYQDGDITLFLPPEAALHMDALNRVAADFLPSDVRWRIVILSPYAVVSGHTYLGINTRIGAFEKTTVGQSRIGFSVVGGAE